MWTFFISLRYFFSKRKEGMISLIGIISSVGVALGVASLIIVLSVMNGFDKEVREKIIGTYSHIIVVSEGGIADPVSLMANLKSVPEVVAASPFITGQVILKKDDVVTGVLLKGIDPIGEREVTSVIKYTEEGADLSQAGTIVLGSELMANEKIRPGDEIEVVLPYSTRDVKTVKMKVVGSFTSGRYDYDANMAVVNLDEAKKLFRTDGAVSGIGLKVEDEMEAEGIKRRLQLALGYPYIVKSWMDLDKNLVTALQLEKKMMFMILALIVMVACFNIAGSLIMMVMEKTRDIGILKAIGANSRGVRLIFLIQGVIVGLVGILAGTAAGIYISERVNQVSGFIEHFTGVAVFPNDVYYFTEIPSSIDPHDILLVVLVAFTLTVLAGLYPALKAARLDPVKAIRYE